MHIGLCDFNKGSWVDFLENLETNASTYDKKLRLHNNDVYLDDVLFRAVELTKLAVWFSDKGLLGKAEQMIMMAHNLGPQKLWDEKTLHQNIQRTKGSQMDRNQVLNRCLYVMSRLLTKQIK